MTNLIKAVLAILGLTYLSQVEALQSDSCLKNAFPIFSGGSRAETAKCMFLDERNEQIIVGGSTLSNDYGPSFSQVGFIYAVDLSGNWKWGNFYFNSSAVTDISGCSLSTETNQIVAMGISLGKPVIMMLDLNGKVENFISVEADEDESRTIKTYGAVHLDNKSQPNIYFSYLAAEKMQLASIRIANKQAQTNWNQEFEDVSVITQPDNFYRMKLPQFLVADPMLDELRILLGGRYKGVGSLMRIYKRNGLVNWNTQIEAITRVQAVVSTGSSQYFLGCGQNNLADRTSSTAQTENQAWIFRVNNEGQVEWMFKIAGDKPSKGGKASDNCLALTYSAEDGLATALIQTKSPQLRIKGSEDNSEFTLLVFNQAATLFNALTVNFGSKISLQGFPQNMVWLNDRYYVGGMAEGFITKFQTDKGSQDTFVARLEFFQSLTDQQNACLETAVIPISKIGNKVSQFSQFDSVKQFQVLQDSNVDRSNLANDFLKLYSNTKATAIELRQDINNPRPCAKNSVNLKEMDYNRGEKQIEFNLGDEAWILYRMSLGKNRTSIINHGSSLSPDEATFSDDKKGLITFKTSKAENIGRNHLTIRNCDDQNNLNEINFFVEVASTAAFVFQQPIKTVFYVKLGEVLDYIFPAASLSKGQERPLILVEPFEGYENYFPGAFLIEFDTKDRIQFAPSNSTLVGQTYYFKFVVRARNAPESQGQSYYCSVQVFSQTQGPEPEPLSPEEKEKLPLFEFFNLTYLSRTDLLLREKIDVINRNQDKGFQYFNLQFSVRMHMNLIEKNFQKMFKYFVRRSDFDKRPVERSVVSIEPIEFNFFNQTVCCRVKFFDPSDFGLLIRKNDSLVFETREDFDFLPIFYEANATLLQQRRLQNTTAVRVDMVFDWSLPSMERSRRISKVVFWIVVGFSAVQWIALVARNVSGIGFYAFLEHAQLVSLMPLMTARYNPALYEVFKTFLWSNLIFNRDSLYYHFASNYHSENARFYGLSNWDIWRSAIIWAVVLLVIIIADAIVHLIHKSKQAKKPIILRSSRNQEQAIQENLRNSMSSTPSLLERIRRQFRFNIYIRFLMFSYLDLLLNAMLGVQKEEGKSWFSIGRLFAVLCLIALVTFPIVSMLALLIKFDFFLNKTSKKTLGALLEKIDKGTRYRVIQPAFFFIRRIMTAYMITLSLNPESQSAYIQFTVIITFSVIYIWYLLQFKPYVSGAINYYVLLLEANYLTVAVMSYFFTDATPSYSLKNGAYWVILLLLILMVFINIGFSVYFLIVGSQTLKQKFKQERDLRRKDREERERLELEDKEKKKQRRQKRLEEIGARKNPNHSTATRRRMQSRYLRAGTRLIDDHRSSSSDEDFQTQDYQYTPTPQALTDAETKRDYNDDLYSSVKKGNETERGLLVEDTRRTDRSRNAEITDQSVREDELYRLESQNSGRLSLRVRPSKVNQSGRSAQVLAEDSQRKLIERDISWQIPQLLNHQNDKSGTINENIYNDDINLQDDDTIRKSNPNSLAQRQARMEEVEIEDSQPFSFSASILEANNQSRSNFSIRK